MEWSQHARITKSLNRLLGNQPAWGFLVLHERERWVMPVQIPVVLVESPRFYAKATRVAWVQRAPILELGDRGLVTTRFSLFGRRFVTSPALKHRLIDILS